MVSAAGGQDRVGWGELLRNPSGASLRARAAGGLAQVYHRAGRRPDPMAQLILHNITPRTHTTPSGACRSHHRSALARLKLRAQPRRDDRYRTAVAVVR